MCGFVLLLRSLEKTLNINSFACKTELLFVAFAFFFSFIHSTLSIVSSPSTFPTFSFFSYSQFFPLFPSSQLFFCQLFLFCHHHGSFPSSMEATPTCTNVIFHNVPPEVSLTNGHLKCFESIIFPLRPKRNIF